MKHTAITHRFNDLGRRQRGASLLEAIAYLGIAAVVILGAVSMLNSAFNSAQANRVTEQLISIRTGVKKLFMGRVGNYGTVDFTAAAVNAGIFPSTIATSSTTGSATNDWSGAVKIVGNTGTFTISYEAVPRDICIAAISGATGWTEIAVGTDAGSKINTFPVSPVAANTACNAASNTISLSSN
ncbi:type 4 pilus major pilin [Actimicrobium sp. CCI2.3]|uniref:type 4 pilus major pilin n=1 Tax=Actimicrobium sp. CCI2.3 TaxID=3048616 RepID=UPI002AB527A5|nr:type 4 pilus major pilin [Actimicrobium sp. CCI2.3]MDY7573514.1 type 4 pilus major pilin [Actimicrobium sp. CCI2.3]MEB0022695.1 type 4 pilus major pilin [Actimicrobium sp. CCI2.3]